MAWKRNNKPTDPSGLSIAELVVIAMQPGEWYAQPDVRALLDWSVERRGDVRVKLLELWRGGRLDRARNPDHEPDVYEKGRAFDPRTLKKSPPWLYRMTEAGELYRAGALMLK